MATRKTKSSPLREAIIRAIARAFFVDNWATRQEDNAQRTGKQLKWAGKDLYDLAPRTSRHALTAAYAAAARMESANGKSLDAIYEQAIHTPGKHTPGSSTPEHFGSDIGLEMLGHGVSWFDDHPGFELAIPDVDYYT